MALAGVEDVPALLAAGLMLLLGVTLVWREPSGRIPRAFALFLVARAVSLGSGTIERGDVPQRFQDHPPADESRWQTR